MGYLTTQEYDLAGQNFSHAKRLLSAEEKAYYDNLRILKVGGLFGENLSDDDEDTEKEKELKARIAALEDDKEEDEKEKIAKEFVQLYPENIRQAKFDAIIASKVKSAVLTEQFKVAQDLSEATTNKNQYVPVKVSTSAFLTKQASLNKTVPAWRT